MHSMNRIQSKGHRIETYDKICFSCFDDKIHILNNRHGGLDLDITVNYEKTVILVTIQSNYFVKLRKYYFNFRSIQDSFLSGYKNIILIFAPVRILFFILNLYKKD